MALPLLPLIGAGAGLLGSGIAAGTSRRNTRRTIRANKEMAQFAYQRDLEMWQRQNRYNHPESQMQRLRQAGLNPNLVYGQGAVGNTAGQMPRYNAPRLDYQHQPLQLGPALSNYQDVQLKQAQIDNLKANEQNVSARTATELVRKSNYLTDNEKKKLELGIAEKLEETTVETGQQKLNILRQTLTNKQRQQIRIELMNEYQRRLNNWMKAGVTPKDALWIRSSMQLLQSLGIDQSWFRSVLKNFKLPFKR